jgi:hypothetical protein
MERLLTAARWFLASSTYFGDALLSLVLVKGKATLATRVGCVEEAEPSSILEDLSSYGDDPSQYMSMDQDKWRNVFFRNAIQDISRVYKDWLEIGPGGAATLSRMVIGASTKNKLLGVEYVDAAAQAARHKLRDARERACILTGPAGDVDWWRLEDWQTWRPTALVAEILGHFASSEGYLDVLRAIRENYDDHSDIQAAVPAFFGTVAVPVNLARLTTKVRIVSIGSTIALF